MNDPTADTTGPDSLEIPRRLHDAMVAHCLREAPLECCGLLGGVASRVSSFHPLPNVADRRETRYVADSQALITAIVWLRERQAKMIAIYHSHPRSKAIPSKTDLRENHYGPVPRIIVSLVGSVPDVRIWRLDADSYEELAWTIVEDEADQAGDADEAAGPDFDDGGPLDHSTREAS